MRTREKKNTSLHKSFLSKHKQKTRNRRKKVTVRRRGGMNREDLKPILKIFFKYAFVCACIIICNERTHLLEGFNMAYKESSPIIQWFITVLNMFCSSVSSVHMKTNQAITSLVTLISPAALAAAKAAGTASAAADEVLNKFLYDMECWGLNSGLAVIITGCLARDREGALGPITQMENLMRTGHADAAGKITFAAEKMTVAAGKSIELFDRVNAIGRGIKEDMLAQFTDRMDVVNAVEARINADLDILSEKLADISVKTIFVGVDVARWFVPTPEAIQEKIDIGEEAAAAFADGVQAAIPHVMRVMRITNDCAVKLGAKFGAMNQMFIRSKPYLVDLLDSCFTFVQGYFEVPEMADVPIENGLPRGGALWEQLKGRAQKLTTLTSRPLHPDLEAKANEVFIPLSEVTVLPDDVSELSIASTLIDTLESEYHSVDYVEEHSLFDPSATPSPLRSGSFGRGSPVSPGATRRVEGEFDAEASPSLPPTPGGRKKKKGGANEINDMGDKQYKLLPLKWTDRNIKYMIESSLENGMIVDDQGITFYTFDLQADLMKKNDAYRSSNFMEPLVPTNEEERATYVRKFVESLKETHTPPSEVKSEVNDEYNVLCNALSFKPRFYAPGAYEMRGQSPRSSIASTTSVNSVGSLRNQLVLASTSMIDDSRQHLLEVLRGSTKRKFIDI